MTYKKSKKALLQEGLIKKCPVDYMVATNLIKRAYTDLKTAKRNLADDEECAYNYAYNAMLHSGMALMACEGCRPEIKDKHLTIVKFVSSILGNRFEALVNNYDFMRRKRHRFIYEPGLPCSRKEAEDALQNAEAFLNAIHKLIKKKNPQLEFDFYKIGDVVD